MEPFFTAVRLGNTKLVEQYINQGCDVNESLRFNGTALHIACRRDYLEIINLLVKAGCDVGARNHWGIFDTSQLKNFFDSVTTF